MSSNAGRAQAARRAVIVVLLGLLGARPAHAVWFSVAPNSSRAPTVSDATFVLPGGWGNCKANAYFSSEDEAYAAFLACAPSETHWPNPCSSCESDRYYENFAITSKDPWYRLTTDWANSSRRTFYFRYDMRSIYADGRMYVQTLTGSNWAIGRGLACPECYGFEIGAYDQPTVAFAALVCNALPDTSGDACQKPCKDCVGNPVLPPYGRKRESATDVVFGGRDKLAISRTYDSSQVARWVAPGVSGTGWRFSFERYLAIGSINGLTSVRRHEMWPHPQPFFQSGSGFVHDVDTADVLKENRDTGGNRISWTYYASASDEFEQYDLGGRLQTIESRDGARVVLAYDAAGNVVAIGDTFGRKATLQYDGSRLASVTDPIGNKVEYQYTGSNLTGVTYRSPTGAVVGIRAYLYENSAFPNGLTGIVDENGGRYSTYTYERYSPWRVRATVHHPAAGVESERYGFAYFGSYAQTNVTMPTGLVNAMLLANVQGALKTTSNSQPCPGCGSAMTYDANGNVSSRTDFNGKKTCYSHDPGRNLETARVEGILSGESCATVLATLPTRAEARKTSTRWHRVWRLPTMVAEPNRITTSAYNGDGGVYCAPAGALVQGNPIGVLCAKTVQETIDPTGQQAFAATPTGTPRSWQYTYDGRGQLLKAIDPNGNVTATTYYAPDDADLGKRGNVRTITNPLGHATTFTAYDANGRPTSITDANGIVTTLAYHPRGWLTSRTVGGERTVFDYDRVGQLARVTRPDGSYLAYTYDGAHRLTQIADGLGNRIDYTLDAMGNRIREEAFDPSGMLARTRAQVFDSLNRLHQNVGAQ